MSLPQDYLIERKNMKYKIQLWKGLFFVPIAFLIFIIFAKNSPYFKEDKFIAKVYIENEIEEDLEKLKKIEALAKNKNVVAVILAINSPGGSVGGSEQLYLSIKKIRDEKPVVAVMGTVAASGGYLISLATDRIFAHASTLTGSIGVVSMSFEATELAEKLGVKFNSFKSSATKAGVNPFEKVTPEIRETQMALVNDLYEFFVEVLVKERELDYDVAKKLADGRVYTGRQALALNLVDGIGGQDEALEWLETQENIDSSLQIKDVSLEEMGVISRILDSGKKASYNLYKAFLSLVVQNKLYT